MSAVTVGPGTFVELHYTLRAARGAVLERTRDAGEPLGFVWGDGEMVPGVEAALEGACEGDVITVEVPAEDAYGPRSERDIFAVERSEFPDPGAVALGDEFIAEGDDGAELAMRVTELHPEHVIVDANHPYAGMDLEFTLEVLAVRAVT